MAPLPTRGHDLKGHSHETLAASVPALKSLELDSFSTKRYLQRKLKHNVT